MPTANIRNSCAGPVEIDHAIRLPTAARARIGMRTDCDACGEPIEEEFFYGAFASGRPNMKLHERCTPVEFRGGSDGSAN